MKRIYLLIQRLGIRKKLMLLFGSVIIPITLLTALALSNVKARINDIETIYDDRVIPLKQLKKISDLYAIFIVDCVHKVRSGQFTPEEGVQNLDKATQGIEAEWKAYSSTNLVSEEAEIIRQLDPLFKASNEAVEEARDLMTRKDYEGLGIFAEQKLYPRIDPVTSKIEELIQLQLKITDSISALLVLINSSMVFALESVCSASRVISLATTANPLPCSPARAASIAALSANKFTFSEISLMIAVMDCISTELPSILAILSERSPIVFILLSGITLTYI
ncbi:MCP four helix bundle domain-containing protein, partial [Leptospira ellisii]|uniref:MCP four helix bundle domain-containing protein n=1 Tax=Leptospira ellisii TaxID=2023197 RepID=UPI001A9E84A4